MDISKLQDDLDKLDGEFPHNGPENKVRNCKYFAQGLEVEYGKSLEDLREIVEGPI